MEILEIKGSNINHHYIPSLSPNQASYFHGGNLGPLKFPDLNHGFHPRHSAHRSMGSRGKTQPEGVVAVVVQQAACM